MQNLRHMKAGLFVSVVILMACFCLRAQTNPVTVIKAGRLIDTTNGQVLTNVMVLIEGEMIKSVGADLNIPAGARIIDLSNATVLPGFIDTHTHITGEADANYYDMFRKSFVDAAIIAHLNARKTLDAGFTTIRDVGSAGFVDVALRNAINAGKIPGPRIQCAGYYIGSTGSHGDLIGFSPWLSTRMPEEMSGVADGPDALRKKVRYLIKYGADVIKFGASAGVLSEEASVGAPQFTQEEMNAIVDEAMLHGIKTAAHAHGTEAIKMAIKAGVASIEHGSLIDTEGIRMMKEHGTYLSADIYNDDYILSQYSKLGYPDKIIDKEKQVGRLQRENFQKAVTAGVKPSYGTDAGVYPHGWNAKQFFYMVKYGLTPMQAIQAATVNGAELLGWSDKIGSISAGKYADIIAVAGDPLLDVAIFEKMQFVMKGGTVYRNDLVK